MGEWRIKVRVWGFFGSKGVDNVGPEYQAFNVPVINDFQMASRFAEAFAMGIRCNPKVWQANIVSVEEVSSLPSPPEPSTRNET